MHHPISGEFICPVAGVIFKDWISFEVMKIEVLEKLRKKARAVKAEITVLGIAYQDKRTPLLCRMLIGITIAYMLSPIDLIPDFIPILGLLDDLIIVPALISLSIKYLPPDVLKDARTTAHGAALSRGILTWVITAAIIGLWLIGIYYAMRSFAKKE